MTDAKPDALEAAREAVRGLSLDLWRHNALWGGFAAWEKERATPHIHDALADSYARLRAAVEKVLDEIKEADSDGIDAVTGTKLWEWADALDAALRGGA